MYIYICMYNCNCTCMCVCLRVQLFFCLFFIIYILVSFQILMISLLVLLSFWKNFCWQFVCIIIIEFFVRQRKKAVSTIKSTAQQIASPRYNICIFMILLLCCVHLFFCQSKYNVQCSFPHKLKQNETTTFFFVLWRYFI